MSGLHVISGSELGTQLHGQRWPERDDPGPSPVLFIPPRMTDPDGMPAAPNQPYGGLWTCCLTAAGSSAFVEMAALKALFGKIPAIPAMWTLQPRPDARIVAITNRADWHAAASRYPLGPNEMYPFGSLDFEAIAADGYDAVHLSRTGAIECPDGFDWDHESTFWLRWVFTSEPARADPSKVRYEIPVGLTSNNPMIRLGYNPLWFMTKSVAELHAMKRRAARLGEHGVRALVLAELMTDVDGKACTPAQMVDLLTLLDPALCDVIFLAIVKDIQHRIACRPDDMRQSGSRYHAWHARWCPRCKAGLKHRRYPEEFGLVAGA